ncbi:MAG: methyltransferase [Candidatus Diapherotrites archaeon]|uniref:Methyltransferase n=1 Tax=Candidatus Iainarchaeum sp. TaxID=3101447 RepID=A0A8T3YIK5_9ARCH|nr:methyltransferase [Candidatus Diapherotrites archaeon]
MPDTRTARHHAGSGTAEGLTAKRGQKPGTAEFLFSGKTFSCPESVYFPSEDSCFLAETVKVKKGASAIDMGCGTGIQAVNALMKGASGVLCLDINDDALAAAASNCAKAGFHGKAEVRKSDLFGNCPEKADLIIFNPPYVPSDGIKYAELDGGKKGREVLDRLLMQLPAHLNAHGEAWFLQTDINCHSQTGKTLKRLGLGFEIASRKRIFFEELAVYRCWKTK